MNEISVCACAKIRQSVQINLRPAMRWMGERERERKFKRMTLLGDTIYIWQIFATHSLFGECSVRKFESNKKPANMHNSGPDSLEIHFPRGKYPYNFQYLRLSTCICMCICFFFFIASLTVYLCPSISISLIEKATKRSLYRKDRCNIHVYRSS